MLKSCSSCGNEKTNTQDNFIPAKECRDGLSKRCRDCHRKYMRDWKNLNKDRISERRRHLYAERHAASQALKRRQLLDRAPTMARAKVLRAGMVERSRKLGLPFEGDVLTTEWLFSLLSSQPFCSCCEVPLDYSYKHDGVKKNNSPSIDRIVPKKGYIETNVALICWRCNNLKRDATASELETIARWIRAHTPERTATNVSA